MRPLGQALLHSDWSPYKRNFEHTETPGQSMHGGERSCEDTVGRRRSASQGERPRKKPTQLTARPWTSSLQNCEKIACVFLTYLDCGILFWQPQLTNIPTVFKSWESVNFCVLWTFLSVSETPLSLSLPTRVPSKSFCQNFPSQAGSQLTKASLFIIYILHILFTCCCYNKLPQISDSKQHEPLVLGVLGVRILQWVHRAAFPLEALEENTFLAFSASRGSLHCIKAPVN